MGSRAIRTAEDQPHPAREAARRRGVSSGSPGPGSASPGSASPGSAVTASAVTTHVLDTALGQPAAGVAVRLEFAPGDDQPGDGPTELGRSVTDADGRARD